MTSKSSLPPIPKEPSEEARQGAADFLDRPEFEPRAKVKQTCRVLALLVPLLVLVLIAGAGYGGYRYYLARHATKAATAQSKAPDPYAGWKTYTDVGYAATSGISLKYPPDWHVTVGGSKVYGWSIGGVNVRSVDLSSPYASESPKQEWDTCATTISADACGANPTDKTITDSEATVNGLATYNATMQTTKPPIHTYYVTVVRGSGLNPGGDGVPFVEFTMQASDATNLAIFRQMMASVSFNTASSSADAYSGWKTYTSSYEKLAFKYPPDWKVASSSTSTEVAGADSSVLTSPSGVLSVAWYSAVEGIGGACSTQIMPGTTSSTDSLGPCAYWYVLDKQKLTGADLYYVDGIEELSDGKGYIPWCGLQAASGIVQNESNIGYMLFQSKYNHFKGSSGQDLGPVRAELACGNQFNGTIPSAGTTKEEATAFLSNPEMQQAKLILLSASY